MTPTTTTTSRLLALLSLLQTRRDWPGQVLADRLGISHRTVRRDFVSARFRGSDRADTWPCTGKVVIDLPAAAVLPFAGGGTVEDLGPGRCALEAGSWSWVALAASLGRFDADVEVVGPPELKEAFGALATRYAATASPA